MAKGLETRRKILEAAGALFYKEGFHRVGIPDVARALGIGHATIYEYFKDKEAIYLELCIRAVEQARGLVDEWTDPHQSAKENLKGYVRGNMQAGHHHPEWVSQLVSLYHFAGFSPELKQMHKDIRKGTVHRLTGYVLQGVREGAWKPKSAERAARLIHDLLIGEMIMQHHDLEELDEAKRTQLIWSAVLRILRD